MVGKRSFSFGMAYIQGLLLLVLGSVAEKDTRLKPGIIILPTQTVHYFWEIPQNYHRFAACLITVP